MSVVPEPPQPTPEGAAVTESYYKQRDTLVLAKYTILGNIYKDKLFNVAPRQVSIHAAQAVTAIPITDSHFSHEDLFGDILDTYAWEEGNKIALIKAGMLSISPDGLVEFPRNWQIPDTVRQEIVREYKNVKAEVQMCLQEALNTGTLEEIDEPTKAMLQVYFAKTKPQNSQSAT